MASTGVEDLPDAILTNIIAAISDVRSRNSAALVCRKWCRTERGTRASLTLRGNLRDIFLVPTCFQSIAHLDMSMISPWGYALASAADPDFTGHILRRAFPDIRSLTVYARNPSTMRLIAPVWPNIEGVKLVRWHQRPQISAAGDELKILFSECGGLTSLDLSSFYCWTDDVLPPLESYPSVALNLTRLNLLNPSFSEGFKSREIKGITRACPSLKEFRAACMFDSRYIGYVDDEALISISLNCPKLGILHLSDTLALSTARFNLEERGEEEEEEEAKLNSGALIEMFSGLPLLEELVFDICHDIRDSGPALEVLSSKCPKLRSLKLGHFHGVVSLSVESKLDGLALCQFLRSLSVKNAGDLTDMGLIAVGRGCCRLSEIEIHGCDRITTNGMRTVATLLRRTLTKVSISGCRNLTASAALKALEPIRSRITFLHVDCVWDDDDDDDDDGVMNHPSKKCRLSLGGGAWDVLETVSLWIPVGRLLNPLTKSGLDRCPKLAEMRIKVEGDSRELSRPSEREFGLSTLGNFPMLRRLHLDCGDTIGYAHTAPSGQMDLSLWERFYLMGIGHLNLSEVDYWPPQDRDVNQRSLSLPAAGLLQECVGLRKLFIHGTTHEHFMMFLLRIPEVRDVQLREDYYPAPENDMSTEMRADSCSRFEAALNRRPISD
ncbi:hypothetical protein M569_08217 [Genlisea aurea]|uniref:COI1 F-box domain-containing protein n=1 Tax=Genlisea aurea TaxID=192259 RepID=S8E2Q4_9LAMI|nr:hypothetical protein M569_08217 [Genlisea aurea]